MPADANVVDLRYVKESTFGTPPGGTYTEVRYTGESLKQTTDTTLSNEIRSDRATSDVIRTNIGAAGDVDTEFSYGGFAHDWLQYALLDSAWSAVDTFTSAAVTASTNTLSATGIGTGVNADSWVRVKDATTLIGYYKVASTAADQLTVDRNVAAGLDGDDDEEVEMGAEVVNGTTLSTMTIEKGFTDVASTFQQLVGMAINGFSLEARARNLITAKYSFLGSKATSPSPTASDASGNNAVNTNPVMNAIDNVQIILEKNASTSVTAFTIDINNGLFDLPQVGTLGTIGIGKGRMSATGTIEAYLSSIAMFNKYLAFTETELAIAFQDADGNAYLFDFPGVKFTDGDLLAGGIDTPVLVRLNWATKIASDDASMVRIVRWDA